MRAYLAGPSGSKLRAELSLGPVCVCQGQVMVTMGKLAAMTQVTVALGEG